VSDAGGSEERYFLDANILYSSIRLRLLVELARRDIIDVRWSAKIQEEWQNAILRTRPETNRDYLKRTVQLMDMTVPALVEGYESRIEGLELPDKDDRHVLAAALHSKSDVIVTLNRKDFPSQVLDSYGVTVQGPDYVFENAWFKDPDIVPAVFEQFRMDQRRPAFTQQEFASLLVRNDCSRTGSLYARDVIAEQSVTPESVQERLADGRVSDLHTAYIRYRKTGTDKDALILLAAAAKTEERMEKGEVPDYSDRKILEFVSAAFDDLREQAARRVAVQNKRAEKGREQERGS